MFIENPLCRSKRLPWQKSSVTTWLESDSKLFIKKTKHQKSKKSNRNNNSKKIPQIFVYRREKKPVCAKALKLNFFTNYYFSCSYFLQRIVAKYWSLPLLLKSTELLYKLFYEKISCSAGSLGAATRRVIFVLPLFAIPLLSCLLSCKFIFWRAAALPCEFFARRSESSVWHLFWYVSHSLWWMKTTNNKKNGHYVNLFSFFLSLDFENLLAKLIFLGVTVVKTKSDLEWSSKEMHLRNFTVFENLSTVANVSPVNRIFKQWNWGIFSIFIRKWFDLCYWHTITLHSR